MFPRKKSLSGASNLSLPRAFPETNGEIAEFGYNIYSIIGLCDFRPLSNSNVVHFYNFYCNEHRNRPSNENLVGVSPPRAGPVLPRRALPGHWRLRLLLSGFMCLLGIGKNEPRFLAVPVASELVFIGPVGPSHSHAPRSGRRLNLQSTGHTGRVEWPGLLA